MNNSKVSIIIVNWNGGEVFKNCLVSLSKLTYKNWSVVVVDNASTDGSQEYGKKILGSKAKTIVNSENIGFATANNQAIKYCKGEYVLLLNNDTIVQQDFLNILVEKADSNNSLGVIQPKIYLMDKKNHLDNAGSFLTRIGFFVHWGFMDKDGPKYNKEREVFSAKGACMLIRREVIEKVGLFDDRFTSYFEETDFCWKVWLIGYKVLFYPRAHIYHKVGYTIKRQNVLELNYHYYKNRICSLIKNLGTEHLITILPIHLLISVGISLTFLLRGKISNTLFIWRAIFWNLVNLPATLEERHIIQQKRIVLDQVLFAKLAQKVDWRRFFNDFKRVEKDIATKNNY